jgi:hypothetical protein
MKEQYVVYEKVPAHGSEVNGIILGPFKTQELARLSKSGLIENILKEKINKKDE